jgi:hypothetical protein
MMKQLFRILFVFLVASISVCANAKGKIINEIIPCSQVKGALAYKNFGFETPTPNTGWNCVANVNIKTGAQTEGYRWTKAGTGTITIAGGPIQKWSDYENKTFTDNPKAKEPYKTVRMYFESFFGDPDFLKENKDRLGMLVVNYYSPKAVLFSSEDNFMVVYYNNRKDKEQRVLVFKDENEKDFFTAHCSDCSPDDFFKYVINPIIQK